MSIEGGMDLWWCSSALGQDTPPQEQHNTQEYQSIVCTAPGLVCLCTVEDTGLHSSTDHLLDTADNWAQSPASWQPQHTSEDNLHNRWDYLIY